MKRALAFLLLLAGCQQDPSSSSPVPAPPATAPALDGSSVGNGGEDLPADADSAWFLGTRRLRFCLHMGGDFGVDEATALELVDESMRAWRRYLMKHRVTERLVNELGPGAEGFPLRFDYDPTPICDGSESLTFYLGVENEKVARARLRYRSPIAFAHRESYDASTGWGHGFIWLRSPKRSFPNWSDRYVLREALLHEIGHVVGCGHVEGTVMARGLGAALRYIQEAGPPPIGMGIDRDRVLFVGPVPPASVTVQWPKDKTVVIVDIVELDRERGEIPIFKVAFRPSKTTPLRIGHLTTERVHYVGKVLSHGLFIQRLHLLFNAPAARYRVLGDEIRRVLSMEAPHTHLPD